MENTSYNLLNQALKIYLHRTKGATQKKKRKKDGREGKRKGHSPFSYRIELECFGNLWMNGWTIKPFLTQKIDSTQHQQTWKRWTHSC